MLCSGGCALLAVSSLLAIVTIFLPGGGCERRICTLAGYMQMAAGECRPAPRTWGWWRGPARQPAAAWSLLGLIWASEGTERFRGCWKRTIPPPELSSAQWFRVTWEPSQRRGHSTRNLTSESGRGPFLSAPGKGRWWPRPVHASRFRAVADKSCLTWI